MSLLSPDKNAEMGIAIVIQSKSFSETLCVPLKGHPDSARIQTGLLLKVYLLFSRQNQGPGESTFAKQVKRKRSNIL